MLGKIIDGVLTYPPHRIVIDGRLKIIQNSTGRIFRAKMVGSISGK